MLKTTNKPIYNSNDPIYHQKYQSDIIFIFKNMNIQERVCAQSQQYGFPHSNRSRGPSGEQSSKGKIYDERLKYRAKDYQNFNNQNYSKKEKLKNCRERIEEKTGSKYQYKQKLKYQPKLYKQNNQQNQKFQKAVKIYTLPQSKKHLNSQLASNDKKQQLKKYEQKHIVNKNRNSNCFDIINKEDYQINNKLVYRQHNKNSMLKSTKYYKNCDALISYDEQTQSTISSPQRSQIQNNLCQHNQKYVNYEQSLDECLKKNVSINLDIYGSKFNIQMDNADKLEKKLHQIFSNLFQLDFNNQTKLQTLQIEKTALKLIILSSICTKIQQNEEQDSLKIQFKKLKQESMEKYMRLRLEQSFGKFD